MTGRPARPADARLDRLVDRGLRLGGAILVIGAVAMLVAPSAIAPYFGLERMDEAGDFMTRRYGAAGTLGLGVALWLARDRPAASAVLGGVASWFFVQGGVAIAGLVTGIVSGAAWLALAVDLPLGIGALLLAARLASGRGAARPGGLPVHGLR